MSSFCIFKSTIRFIEVHIAVKKLKINVTVQEILRFLSINIYDYDSMLIIETKKILASIIWENFCSENKDSCTYAWKQLWLYLILIYYTNRKK